MQALDFRAKRLSKLIDTGQIKQLQLYKEIGL